MNKKRVTAVILSAMMCMQIFTGCGAKNNAAAVEGGAGQTATESAQGAAVQSQRKMHRQQRKMCRERQIRMEQKKA